VVNVVVAVTILSAVVSISIGTGTAAVMVMLKRKRKRTPPRPDRPPGGDRTVYWSFAAWTILLGLFLLCAPQSWYGPSWSYFPQLPHNGYGMGVCLIILASLQVWTLYRRGRDKTLSILFFLSGFVYWTSGIILAAEGLLGHQGLMEAPFMLYVGAHKFTHSAKLMADA
jgi:hypothetical protein